MKIYTTKEKAVIIFETIQAMLYYDRREASDGRSQHPCDRRRGHDGRLSRDNRGKEGASADKDTEQLCWHLLDR